MTHRTTALLLCPAAIGGLVALIYVLTRHREPSAILGEIRDSLKENVSETRALHHTLRRQRAAINGLHRYIVPVTKGV
jgi:hypothetical protein